MISSLVTVALCLCGRLKKRAGDEPAGSGRERGGDSLLFTPGSRSQLIPLVARSLFRSSSLTESLEQATEYTETDTYESREMQQMYSTLQILSS